jgi:hypothetical protein
MTRREMIAAMTAVAVLPTAAQASHASRVTRTAVTSGGYAPKIYTPHEWQTVRTLVDYIFPRDERSGSATEAMVPEFMDQMLFLEPGMRTAHRGGLAWLDHECTERFGSHFVGSTDVNSFRDLTATGFWTSEIGVRDIGYMGNTPQAAWNGCPAENTRRLGF